MKNTPEIKRKEIDIEKLQAELYLHYGHKLDETSVIILRILTEQQYLNFSTQNKAISEAVQAITDSQKSIQVDRDRPGWQAFCFGFGKLGAALIIVITVLTVMFGLYFDNGKEKNNTVELEWYQDYFNHTRKIISKKKIVDYIKKHPLPPEDSKQKK